MARFADRINNKKNKWNNSASVPSLAGTVGAVTGAAKPSGASAVPDAALISAISGSAAARSSCQKRCMISVK